MQVRTLGRMQYKPLETIARFCKSCEKNALPPPRASKKYVLPPLHEVKIIVYPPPSHRRLLNLPHHNKEHETNIHVQVVYKIDYQLYMSFNLAPLIN